MGRSTGMLGCMTMMRVAASRIALLFTSLLGLGMSLAYR